MKLRRKWDRLTALAVLALTLLPLAGNPQAQSVADPTAGVSSVSPVSAVQVTGFDQCRNFFPGSLPKVPAQRMVLARDLCYDAFAILHSGQSKTPIFAVERLTRESLNDASHEKRHNRFFADARLRAKERATLEDYKGSGYDRGHMAPAADMPTAQANDQSFSLANMVPQARLNNERTWAGIERATRHHVARAKGAVFVFTGPVFETEPVRTIGTGQVWVPTHLFKLVYDQEAGRAWAYWIENRDEAHAGHPITYEELVRRTSIEFLPGIAPAH